MEGCKAIEPIMQKIEPHLKPNTEKEHHYNRVYEAIWEWYKQITDEIKDRAYAVVEETNDGGH